MKAALNTALGVLLFTAMLLTPALIFWVWSRQAVVPRARRVLQLTALISLACVAVLIAVTVTADALCDGSQLIGFTDCRIVPLWLANLSLATFLLVSVLVPVLGLGSLGMLLLCAWLEWRAGRAGP